MTDSGKEREGKELRQTERWHLVYYLRVFDGMTRNILGHLIDISEKGVMLICDKPVEVTSDYRLRMCLPNRMLDRDEVVFSAISRWCKSDANPDFYLVGFQIHDLESETRELIADLIREFSHDRTK